LTIDRISIILSSPRTGKAAEGRGEDRRREERRTGALNFNTPAGLWTATVKMDISEVEAGMKKAILKRTADMLEKLAIAGIALALWQQKTDMVWLAGVFLALSYVFTVWEAKQ